MRAPPSAQALRRPMAQPELLPSARSLLSVLILFIAALALTRVFEQQIVSALSGYGMLGVAVFFATTALAVVLPLFTNLPLVPLAVLLWGPWWTALVMLLGWIAGSATSFALARHLSDPLLRRFPRVRHYADIDRLILPAQPILSLVVLRMTFPVDILSYVLGLFSARTTALDNLISTAIGTAPFALLFVLFPALSLPVQSALLAISGLAFAAYALWVRRAPHRPRISRRREHRACA